MFKIKNFNDNDNVKIIEQAGPFSILEYQKDLSVYPSEAVIAYFSKEMNIKKRQIICNLNNTSGVTLQAGAMQFMVGDVQAATGVKSAKDLVGKLFTGKVTGETAIKPEYSGTGFLVTEPTYKHIIPISMNEWNNSVVLDDGLFIACESSIRTQAVMRKSVSSAVAGGEGLFSLGATGEGILLIESVVPKNELVEVELQNDQIKIDGNMAIAWSKSLDFTVERTTRSLVGSAASGEGLVNVYRGTGKILMAPVVRRPIQTL